MARKVVSFRLTGEFDAWVAERAAQHRISRTAVVRTLLAVALANEDNRAMVRRRLEALSRATAEGEGI